MSTDQNYDANAVSQDSFESTGENATQTAQNEGQQSRFKTQAEFDEWYNTFVDEYFVEVSKKRGPAEYIRHILSDLSDFREGLDPTVSILELCEEKMDRSNGLSPERTRKIQDVMSACRLLVKLREYTECLRNETLDFGSQGPVQ